MPRVQTKDTILKAVREKVPSYIRGKPIRIPADLTIETLAAGQHGLMSEALNQTPCTVTLPQGDPLKTGGEMLPFHGKHM